MSGDIITKRYLYVICTQADFLHNRILRNFSEKFLLSHGMFPNMLCNLYNSGQRLLLNWRSNCSNSIHRHLLIHVLFWWSSSQSKEGMLATQDLEFKIIGLINKLFYSCDSNTWSKIKMLFNIKAFDGRLRWIC